MDFRYAGGDLLNQCFQLRCCCAALIDNEIGMFSRYAGFTYADSFQTRAFDQACGKISWRIAKYRTTAGDAGRLALPALLQQAFDQRKRVRAIAGG